MSEYTARTTRISIAPKGEPIFSECCTHVEIADEAGGEYVLVRQQSAKTDADSQSIQIDPKEWPILKLSIEQMFENIKENEAAK